MEHYGCKFVCQSYPGFEEWRRGDLYFTLTMEQEGNVCDEVMLRAILEHTLDVEVPKAWRLGHLRAGTRPATRR